MKIFKKPNLSNMWECPVCKKNDKKQVVLIGIDGTEKEDNMECGNIKVLVYKRLHGELSRQVEAIQQRILRKHAPYNGLPLRAL